MNTHDSTNTAPESARRPIRARSLRVVQYIARALARAEISPNQISSCSVLFSLLVPGALFFFGNQSWGGCLLAVLGIQLRLLCNLLDGIVAIEWQKKSAVGDIYNEFPDRLSDTIILLGVAYSIHSLEFAHSLAWATCFFAALTAYVRVLGASLKTKHYFSGPMAKPQRMAFVTFALLLCPLAKRAGGSADFILVMALYVVCFGAVITVIRRLAQIMDELNAR